MANIKVKMEVETVRFYKPETRWGIITFSVKEYMEGSELKHISPRSVAKGMMPEPMIGGEYFLEAKEVEDPKWGKQFDIVRMYSSLFLNPGDKKGQKLYLETLFTEKQLESMYDQLEDPYDTLLNKDVEALVNVKGCGFKTAGAWIDRFHTKLADSYLCVELSDYGFTPIMIDKMMTKYKSPDLVIDTVKNHPYELIDIDGVGWKRCDAIASSGGLDRHSKERVVAFLKHYFVEMANQGYTYVYANEQMLPAILNELGDDLPDQPILEAIDKLSPMLLWNPERTIVGLKRYITLERNIAQKLTELKKSPNKFKFNGWEEVIKKKEEAQGWSYTEQQISGIQAVLENQVVIISGYGGTGKSSIVSGMLEVLKGCSFAQCALSGRAAARLSELTGVAGYTIHRLLGYPSGKLENGNFFYTEENPLPYDIIIVDEISMVDGTLFWNLIRALSPGTKLIMLGDVGQLESIGCSNIANDLIESPEVTSVVLDKIHRQAAASAIITDSIEARNGHQLIENNFVGSVTKGELQDLTYDCFSDANNTFYRVLEWAEKLRIEGIPLEDAVVVVPNKERQSGTWNLNLALQEIYNPYSEGDKQLFVSYGKGKALYFRVGDKVINTKNTYSSKTYVGQWQTETKADSEGMGDPCPVFNGNMGTIIDINEERKEIVVDYSGIGRVLVTRDMLTSTTLGYAITVHKCQGSEFKHVIFGLDYSAYSLLTRQLVYTAITRASKHCYVVAQTSALRYAISQNSVSKKQTILQDALYEISHPTF